MSQPSTKRLFTRAQVQRAHKAYKGADRSQWALADAVLAAFPPLTRRERSEQGYPTFVFEAGEFLRLAEIPLSVGYLRRLIQVAQVFPPDARKHAAFSVHLKLVGQPDLIEDGMTLEQAEVAVKGFSSRAATREQRTYTVLEGLHAAISFVKGSTARLTERDDPATVGEAISRLEDAVDGLVVAFDGQVLADA